MSKFKIGLYNLFWFDKSKNLLNLEKDKRDYLEKFNILKFFDEYEKIKRSKTDWSCLKNRFFDSPNGKDELYYINKIEKKENYVFGHIIIRSIKNKKGEILEEKEFDKESIDFDQKTPIQVKEHSNFYFLIDNQNRVTIGRYSGEIEKYIKILRYTLAECLRLDKSFKENYSLYLDIQINEVFNVNTIQKIDTYQIQGYYHIQYDTKENILKKMLNKAKKLNSNVIQPSPMNKKEAIVYKKTDEKDKVNLLKTFYEDYMAPALKRIKNKEIKTFTSHLEISISKDILNKKIIIDNINIKNDTYNLIRNISDNKISFTNKEIEEKMYEFLTNWRDIF